MTKSQSLTALPGSTYTPPTSHAQHSYFGSFSSLQQSVPNHGPGMGAVWGSRDMYLQPWKAEDFVGAHKLDIDRALG